MLIYYTKKTSTQVEFLLRNAMRAREETCRALSTSMNEIKISVTFNRKFRLKAGEGWTGDNPETDGE